MLPDGNFDIFLTSIGALMVHLFLHLLFPCIHKASLISEAFFLSDIRSFDVIDFHQLPRKCC